MEPKTTCRYYELTEDGERRDCQKLFAWDNPTDRRGDGQEEYDAFLEVSRDNGFECIRRADITAYGQGLGSVVVDVYEVRSDWDGSYFIGLSIEPAHGWYEETSDRWLELE